MKKRNKKILICAGVVAVVAGGVAVAGNGGAKEASAPAVPVETAVVGDVEQIVDATGTVVSEEQKTFFSPVNAKISEVSFEEGDSVKEGTKLITFDMENLEKDNQKAAMSFQSGKYDYEDTIKKSDKAEKKQSDAKKNVKTLELQIESKKNQVSSLKAQLSQIQAQAARDQAEAQAAQAQAELAAQQKAQEQKNQAIQKAYAEALRVYQNETLPKYQQELGELNSSANQAQSDFNQADTAYQMAFATWQADPSEVNTEALHQAEQMRSQAEITKNQAKEAYETMKAQEPKMPALSDFENAVFSGSDELTDGSQAGAEEEAENVQTGGASYTSVDTSGIERALEDASSDLAELQSELASEKAIAEADEAGLSKEQKEKMKITNNLSEMEAKTAEELLEDGKKGISAEFNGVISKTAAVEGSTVTQGMELFTLQNTDKVSVDINISKYDYDKVKEGQSAEITMADRTYEGKVTKVSHIASPNEKGTPVISATVSILNPDEDIFLGVDAKVKIHAESAENVVTLPVEAVNIGKDGSFCYVLREGVITRQNVTTGLSSQDYVEIKEGLKEGDQVISDLGSLEEGMQAEAQEGEA